MLIRNSQLHCVISTESQWKLNDKMLHEFVFPSEMHGAHIVVLVMLIVMSNGIRGQAWGRLHKKVIDYDYNYIRSP